MIGEILSNRYLVTAEIGAGGMGNVYRATDLRTGGDVAVKVPHAYLARNKEFLDRLRREAQIAASLYSHRVVRVIDLDTHNGLLYLVMEYVPGDTLADVLRSRGRLTLAETLAIGLEVARALDAAHTAGIVHRDLKPQNIKLLDGEVKVLDFGIAKREGGQNITSASIFMGTPEYCAPERIEGPGDIRSDIYSLGVIMFELLEGRLPFKAETPIGMLRQHEQTPPPPLSDDPPAGVREIVRRCLAKSPVERYQTPRELAQALRAALESPSVPLPATLTPDGVAQTVRLPDLHEPDSIATRPSLPAEETAAVPLVVRPGTGGRRARPLLLLAGGILGVLLVAAAGWLLLRDRGGAAQAPPTPVGGVLSPTPGAGGTPTPTLSPVPLLAAGRAVPLTASQEFTARACGGRDIRAILNVRSIELEPTGRVNVEYSRSIPRIDGVECQIPFLADAGSGSITLQTLEGGREFSYPSIGGSGLAVSGAPDIYGRELSGTWVFDKVNPNAARIDLVELNSEGREIYRLRLLPR